ncbi:MAG: hypothetical protein U5K38_03740 [Woeseiaceae bacterium]|nr:hypothetical protein [Woeseiaceae bacterium]
MLRFPLQELLGGQQYSGDQLQCERLSLEVPIMKRAALLILLTVLLIAPHVPAWSGAWGRVFAVEIRSDALAEQLRITDPALVQELSFWVGPGTGFSEFMGPVNDERSIVDWERGEATDRPSELKNFRGTIPA